MGKKPPLHSAPNTAMLSIYTDQGKTAEPRAQTICTDLGYRGSKEGQKTI